MNPPPGPTRFERLMVVALLTLGGWLGLHASLPGTSVGILWPPAGLALGFLLRWGTGLWPTLLLGSLIQTLVVQFLLAPSAFVTHPGRTALLLVIMTAQTVLTPLLAGRLVQPRIAHSDFSLRDALAIFVWGGLLAQIASALGGVLTFWLLGMLHAFEVPRALFVWWAANVTSVGLLAIWMAALFHGDGTLAALGRGRPLRLFFGVALGTTLSFFLPGWLSLPDIHLELLVVFPVLMTAFALGVSGAATAALHCATITLAGTLLGYGAFAHSKSFTTLLSLQVYLLTVMGASLALGDTRRRWKEARKDLVTSEAWFRQVFQGVHDAVVVMEVDPSGELRLEQANARAANLLGWPSTHPPGLVYIPPLASGPLEPSRRESTLAALRAGDVIQELWQVPLPGGDGPWVDGTLQGLTLGGEQRLLLTLRDITDRKAAEAEGERLRSQLLQAQKMEALGLLAAGIAHDFNNLLTALQSYSDLLSDHEIPDVRQTAKRQLEVVARGSELIRALLAFSRPGGTERRLVDLNLQVAESVHLLRRLVGSRIAVSFEPGPGTALLDANPNQLDQVLVNLTCNARDAMPEGGTIALTTDLSEEGCVVLRVGDTGCGMDEDTQARVFEPFFTTKAQGMGTGLGLATVLDIVKDHLGTITVESRPGEGTTFHLRFPKWTEKPAHPASVRTGDKSALQD